MAAHHPSFIVFRLVNAERIPDSSYLISPLIQYNTVMPNLTLQINPSQPVLGPLREQQLCYLLLTISAPGSGLGSGTVPEPSSFVYLVSAAASSISLLNRRRPVIMR